MPLIDNYLLKNFAIDGPANEEPFKLVASGTNTSSTNVLEMLRFETETASLTSYFLQIVGLSIGGVVPKAIIIKRQANGLVESVYVRDLKNSFGSSIMMFGSYAVAVTGNFSVTPTSFQLPVNTSNVQYRWEVYA